MITRPNDHALPEQLIQERHQIGKGRFLIDVERLCDGGGHIGHAALAIQLLPGELPHPIQSLESLHIRDVAPNRHQNTLARNAAINDIRTLPETLYCTRHNGGAPYLLFFNKEADKPCTPRYLWNENRQDHALHGAAIGKGLHVLDLRRDILILAPIALAFMPPGRPAVPCCQAQYCSFVPLPKVSVNGANSLSMARTKVRCCVHPALAVRAVFVLGLKTLSLTNQSTTSAT